MQTRRLLPLILLLLAGTGLHAQPFYSFSWPGDSLDAITTVQRYLSVSPETYLDSAGVEAVATGELADSIYHNLGRVDRPFRQRTPIVTEALPIRPADSMVIVKGMVPIESGVPFAGDVTLDAIFFLRKTPRGMRIEGYDHQRSIGTTIAQLRLLDTSSAYPPSLRPIIGRELSAMLMSNAQMREHLNSHRAEFGRLAEMFAGDKLLQRLGREDRTPVQINNVGIYWGAAAQVIPKSVIDEYLRTASAEEKRAMKTQLDAIAKQRKIGEDTLRSVIARQHLTKSRVDGAVELMHTLRVQFVNAQLPWERAVQFTVAGQQGIALGYIYSPTGALPLISRNEYIYLEDLGDGWWIFRSIA